MRGEMEIVPQVSDFSRLFSDLIFQRFHHLIPQAWRVYMAWHVRSIEICFSSLTFRDLFRLESCFFSIAQNDCVRCSTCSRVVFRFQTIKLNLLYRDIFSRVSITFSSLSKSSCVDFYFRRKTVRGIRPKAQFMQVWSLRSSACLLGNGEARILKKMERNDLFCKWKESLKNYERNSKVRFRDQKNLWKFYQKLYLKWIFVNQ